MVIEKFFHGSFDKQTSSTVQVYCAFSIHKKNKIDNTCIWIAFILVTSHTVARDKVSHNDLINILKHHFLYNMRLQASFKKKLSYSKLSPSLLNIFAFQQFF